MSYIGVICIMISIIKKLCQQLENASDTDMDGIISGEMGLQEGPLTHRVIRHCNP